MLELDPFSTLVAGFRGLIPEKSHTSEKQFYLIESSFFAVLYKLMLQGFLLPVYCLLLPLKCDVVILNWKKSDNEKKLHKYGYSLIGLPLSSLKSNMLCLICKSVFFHFIFQKAKLKISDLSGSWQKVRRIRAFNSS